MRYLRQLADGLEVDPILDELDAHPELWNRHKLRTTFVKTPHSVDDIWVRYRPWNVWEALRALQTDETAAISQFVSEEHDSEWYPGAEHLVRLKEAVFELMAHFQVERLGGILITRIPPHGEVRPHIDGGWHARYYEKLAYQLRSAPGQAFCFEDGAFQCEPGTLYTFDNSKPHWVTNDSDHERITLIICVRRDPRRPTLVVGEGE